MAVAKRHHTVPQFYLRGFADGERLGTVRLPGDSRFVQSVRKAAIETNFYAVPSHFDDRDAFEKVLAAFEADAASVVDSVVNGTWPLKPEHRMVLASFVALQAVRGPEQRRNLEHVAAQMARLEIGSGGHGGVRAWFERQRGVAITDGRAAVLWEQAMQPEGPPVRLAPLAHIREIGNLAEALLPYIAGRPWALVRFDKRSLLTCDSPVGLVPNPDDEPWEGMGYLTAWGITFPLTRKLGLLMTDPMVFADVVPVERVREGKLDRVQEGTTALERFFNENTVASACEWLYHHPDDGRFLPDHLPEPTPLTLGVVGPPIEFSGEPVFGRTRTQ